MFIFMGQNLIKNSVPMMRKKEGFILRHVADQAVVVPTGQLVVDFNCLITLNSTGRWLWEQLDQPQTVETLIKSLIVEFKVDETTARKDVAEFIADLVRLEIIDP